MKLLIAVDMEGISGVVDWIHVDSTHAEYQRFRRIMTADVNAAVAGAAQADVDDMLVTDGHGWARNILIEELDPRARLNSGSPSPFAMVQGIDSGIEAVFFIGYHAHMSTQNAVLAHTWSSAKISNVWLNDRMVGEIGLNASVCGSFGVPVLLISGDQAACAEAQDWIPGLETVVVKKASGREAAECLPPRVAQQHITETAFKAIQRYRADQAPAPLIVQAPIRITVEFLSTYLADICAVNPYVTRLDARRVEFQAPDMPTAYRLFRSAVGFAM